MLQPVIITMREIINISLPADLKKDVESTVKKEHFASTSELFRHIWRWWKRQQLLRDLRQGEKEVRLGKTKVLRSLKDLRSGN